MTGDQGVDLLAKRSGRRIAIQCKGYVSSVGNDAVQQIFTGTRLYHCDVGVVVTNSGFTRGAVQAAQGTGCLLIGENEMVPLIMGQVLFDHRGVTTASRN